MYCIKCGEKNDEKVAFCTKCGERLIPLQENSPASNDLNGIPQVQQPVMQQPMMQQPTMQQPVMQPYNGQNMGQTAGGSKPPKKSEKKMIILLVALLCVFLVLVFVCFFNRDTDKESTGRNNGSGGVSADASYNSSQRGTYVSVSENGDLQIERLQLGDVPMGPQGTYTVFVYLCGSDLESNLSYATKDIQEMMAASTSENVRFVIQTGGSTAWHNDIVQTGELGRYEICDGTIRSLEAQPEAPMGDADTLSAFLKWGVEYAPAAKMGLIFWNHGGGSLVGVCSDKVNPGKLTLAEIDTALAEVSEYMTDKFEFIGFDACLMATVEAANVLVPYADYMYASQELEPGWGWDYTAIGNYLGSNPEAAGDALGKVVADSYYAQNTVELATFSVTDLSKIDHLVMALNSYLKQLNASSYDYETFAMTVRGIYESDNFGKNSEEDGTYTNMVDLGGVINAGSTYANGAQDVLNAIDDAIVYIIDGGQHTEACGLSIYYPLRLNPDDITVFDDIAVSPYYMAFVCRTAHAIANDGDISDYNETEVITAWAEIWGKEATGEAAESLDEYADAQATSNSNLFQFAIEPSYYDFDSDGQQQFGFLLTEESYYNLASISTHAWQILPENVALDLGIRDAGWYKNYWDSTVTCDATGGYHLNYLSDGQPFPQYKLIGNAYSNYGFDTSVYITPVLLNGTPTYLLSGRNIGGNMTNEDGSPMSVPGTDFIWGVWSDMSEDGTFDRITTTTLKAGDVIVPIYHAIDLNTGEEFEYYGEEYELQVPFAEGIFNDLKEEKNGEEYIAYNFLLTDVYGNTYETCYRMYGRVTTTSYNSEGRPVGRNTEYEHIGIYDRLY